MKARGLFLALAVLAGSALPAAAPPAGAVTLGQAADARRYPQAGAVVLLDEQAVTLDAQGRTTREGHLLIKILQDRAVRELGDQQIPFLGDSQRCDVQIARTRLPSGAVLSPEPAAIMEVSAPEAADAPFYSSARLKVVSFPGVQVGAILELSYRIQPRTDAPADPDPQPFMGEMVFAGLEPILTQTLTLRVPVGTRLKYQMFNGGPEPSIQRRGAETRYAWVVRNQAQILPETGMVPYQDLAPRLVWSTAADRRALGRWLHRRFQAAVGASAEVRAKALALTADQPGPEAKAQRLALFVTQDIRNVPLALGRVGYRPTPAATILANRYADPRDKVVLFQALLQAIGRSAQPAWVQERPVKLSRLACLPEYQGLLARVRLPSGVRFYNLSQARARLGELLPWDAGRPALLADAAGGRTLTTPARGDRRQFLHARWALALDSAGTLRGRVTLVFSGLFDHQVRERLAPLGPEQRRVLFQSIAEQIKLGARLTGYRVSELQDLAATPTVTLNLRIPDFACRQADLMVLNLPRDLTPLGRTLALPDLPTVHHPFLVPASFAMAAALSLTLPAGYRIAYQPGPTRLRTGPFAFHVASASGTGGLRLVSTIAWKGGVVRPEAYPALWRTFGRATAPDRRLILLQRVRPDLARGTRPGFAAGRGGGPFREQRRAQVEPVCQRSPGPPLWPPVRMGHSLAALAARLGRGGAEPQVGPL